MAKLNAASRLRNQVLNVPYTVLLVGAGHPDKVIRFNRQPDTIVEWRKTINSSRNDSEFRTVHTPLDLDRGPDGECYAALCQEINRNSRRDIPAPAPIEVAENSKEEWSVAPEDVPVVELNLIQPVSVITSSDTVSSSDIVVNVEVPVIAEPVTVTATGVELVQAPKKRGRPRKTE